MAMGVTSLPVPAVVGMRMVLSPGLGHQVDSEKGRDRLAVHRQDGGHLGDADGRAAADADEHPGLDFLGHLSGLGRHLVGRVGRHLVEALVGDAGFVQHFLQAGHQAAAHQAGIGDDEHLAAAQALDLLGDVVQRARSHDQAGSGLKEPNRVVHGFPLHE